MHTKEDAKPIQPEMCPSNAPVYHMKEEKNSNVVVPGCVRVEAFGNVNKMQIAKGVNNM